MHATITSQMEAGVTPAYNLQASRIRSHHSTASARQAGWHEDVTPRREDRDVTVAMMSNDEPASEIRPRGHERWARVQMRGVRVLSTRPAPLAPPRAQQWQPRMVDWSNGNRGLTVALEWRARVARVLRVSGRWSWRSRRSHEMIGLRVGHWVDGAWRVEC